MKAPAGMFVGLVMAGSACAGEASVLTVGAAPGKDGTWQFDVTVRHGDTGWDHYADRWDVLAPDGTVIATRILAHPHVDEQPFKRSLSGVKIPAGVDRVIIRAHDKVHGHGGHEMTVDLPR